ncbi:MAG: CDGSH iron-sulfur domain-containing protein [Deltaproteobacteria bacterium]|nr:CDGSH iron-sulfur domain-containing protein [Deltaproteobacteria bacterium]
MSKAIIFDKKPALVDLEPGRNYYWCSCGKSKEQPFCDGSHESCDPPPVEFMVKEKGKVALCNCKQTATPPYCDGTHKTLD